MINDFSKELNLYSGKKEITPRLKYRTVGLIMFLIAIGTCGARIFINLLPPLDSTLSDLVFSVLVQIGVFVTMPFLIYKFRLKMTTKEIFAFSSIRKTKWYNCALAVPIAIVAYFVSSGISTVWQTLIAALGYTHSASVPLPENFSFLLMLLNFFLTAVLPGICEEFACRGGFVSTMRKSFLFMPTIIICAIQFGLFHQNITQVFYTAFFGGYMAFLTLKTKSIFPAMIMHFMNNGISVYLDFASTYNFFGGDIFQIINMELRTRPYLVFLAFALLCLIVVGLSMILIYLNRTKTLEQKKEVIAASGYDHTNKRVVLMGEENKEMVKDLDLDKEVYGETLKEELFKPKLADNIFYIGAIVTAVLSTVFSFMFGLVR